MSTLDEEKAGLEAINKLKSSDPPLFLSTNSDLSSSTRLASQYLFTCLKPYSPKSPFEQLLTNGFDAEQIWQQIDLQSQPLIATLKREIKRFEKNPDQILSLFGVSESNGVLEGGSKENGDVGFDGGSEEFEGLSDDDDDDDVEEEEDDDDNEDDDEDEEDDGGDDDSEEEELEDDGDGVPEVEDEFLKIKDLEKYLVREEKKEYGSEDKKVKKKKKKGGPNVDDDDDIDEGEEDDEEEEEDEDELMLYGGDAGDEDSEDNIRYEDFFVPDKKAPKRKRKQVDQSDEEMEDEKDDDSELEDEDEDEGEDDTKMEDDDGEQDKNNLSTFERERESIQAKIKQMEEENLAPKDWTMQGEVSASKRPKDSALEVDLDFEHNVRPPPVITEEVTASLEEIIKKRILEGHFNDVQRAPKLASTAPKETKELDDNKSKKGLAEIYEEEYAQQTGLASAPLSFNDELKKEASGLFKRLCLKLDALSHFHFAPKPVVEDMSIQTNVPAFAMEEIAPVAVSDAAMLAPQEVFSGKKVVKEENEFTKQERKRRRAKKKRKLKAINAKKAASRAPEKPSQIDTEGKE